MAEDLQKQVAELQAEIARLKGETSVTEITLRDRTSIADLFGGPLRGIAYVGRDVGVAGWVRTSRHQAVSFIELSDGTTPQSIQVVAKKDTEGYADLLEKKGDKAGASLFVIGRVVASLGKGQTIDLEAKKIIVLGGCDPDTYPLAKAAHGLEHLRKVAHLRPRTNTIGAMARIRNALAFGTHKFFQERNYVYCHTPLITASDCEGAGEMFQVTTVLGKAQDTADKLKKLPSGKLDYSDDFFKRPAFLAVSGQLNGETYACALSNIYTFGPTFRAEESHTTRHLAEFWMIEPEIAFADLAEDADVAEAYIKYVVRYAMETCPGDVAFFEALEEKTKKEEAAEAAKEAMAAAKAAKDAAKAAQAKAAAEKKAAAEAAKAAAAADPAAAAAAAVATAPEKKKKEEKKAAPAATTAAPVDWKVGRTLRQRLQETLDTPFKRLTYTEAIDILVKDQAEGKIVFKESDIHWGIDLASEHERYLAEVVFKKPLVLMNYPKDIKAFYMRLNDDGKTVAAMDILVPGIGEVVGGSQREERYDVLESRIKGVGLNPESYSWYLDLRRFGTVPHAGFGLGFERLVRFVTGLENIRDTIPFPRYPEHCDF